MGYTVLVSNFRRYFKLASYVSTFTDRSIVIAMGVPSLKVSQPACSVWQYLLQLHGSGAVRESNASCSVCPHFVLSMA